MADIQSQKLLYHLTDIKNLPNIFEQGLLPRSQLVNFSDVADGEIITSRRKLQLENYVPFHFYAGSPFDGRVQLDNKQNEFVLITVRRDFAHANGWKIIPCHPLSGSDIQVLDYAAGFNAIDWTVMNSRDYQDARGRSVCMAECLSPQSVPATRFFNIYVAHQGAETLVNRLKAANGLAFYVDVMPNFFMVRK